MLPADAHPRARYCSDTCRRLVRVQKLAEQAMERKSIEAEREAERRKHLAPRTCLKCGGRFMSEGAWNRICDGCQNASSAINGREYRMQMPRPMKARLRAIDEP